MEKDINKTQEKTQANKKQEGYLKIGGSGSFNFYWIYIIIAATLFGIYFMSSNELSREISYSDFQTMAKNGYFERMILHQERLRGCQERGKDLCSAVERTKCRQVLGRRG